VLRARAVPGAAEVLALEGPLRGLPGGELDVGRREELAGGDERDDVDVLVGDLVDVARPDRLARLGVRRADREDEVEAAGPQERRVELADEVGRADEQVLRRLADARDLAQKLVRDRRADAALVVAHRGEVPAPVDEADGRRQLEDQVECTGEQLGLALRALAAPLRGRDLDERPAEPRRDAFRERGLAGTGRAEEDDRLRWHDGVPRGELALLEREDHAPLDDPLRVLDTAQRVPEAPADRR